jgi:hypothetical protein
MHVPLPFVMLLCVMQLLPFVMPLPHPCVMLLPVPLLLLPWDPSLDVSRNVGEVQDVGLSLEVEYFPRVMDQWGMKCRSSSHFQVTHV